MGESVPVCRWILNLPLLFLLMSVTAVRASTDIDPLFASDDILVVTMVAPITTLMLDRPVDAYLPAKFSYTGADGKLVELDIGVRTRGRFRRRVEICQFAPLRLNFKTSQVAGTLFARQDKFKLVTHCQNDTRPYQQAVLNEYLAYRIFNLLTDVSFRARLLRITYVDTDADNASMDSLAVIVEHQDQLAERIGTETVVTERITAQELDPEYAVLTALFQYFLGNTDFSQIAVAPGENCCHNHELLMAPGLRYYSVPYDFDMTGFVNAPHAGTNPRFKLRSVRQRLYRGRCINNQQLSAAIQVFQDNRDAIYDLINAQEGLTRARRRSHIRFVNGFFDTVDSQRNIDKKLLDACI